MPTRVWLMRHAETSAPALFHGAESDIDLSELGHRQADAVARHFARLTPDVIISSNMLRARQTAEPIVRACGVDLEIEPNLHERKVGPLSRQPISAETPMWRETIDHWMRGQTDYAPAGAESFDQIAERALEVWRRVTMRHEGKSILIVAHGAVIKVMLLSLLDGLRASDWKKLGRVENMAVSELVGDGDDWQAVRLLAVPAEVRNA